MKSYVAKHTTHLGMFKRHDVNRNVDQLRIKRIAKSMIEDGLKVVPMIVTSKFFIVDGQHRFEAAKIAGKGIYFIVDESIQNTPKAIFEAARKFNQTAHNWEKKDYVHGFVVQGKESYKILDDFTKEFPMFTLTERLMLLANSGTKNIEKEEFADGKFEVTNLNIARKWANNLLQLKPYFEKGYNKSVFVRTLLTIMEKKPDFKFEEFLHKVKLRPSSIYLCGDKRTYSEMIEDVYNFKRRADEKLNLRF